MRTAIDRLNNKAGHQYYVDSLTKLHLCRICGTCEHRNGDFWWVGKWSRVEPPCDGHAIAREEWLQNANEDPDPEITSGKTK